MDLGSLIGAILSVLALAFSIIMAVQFDFSAVVRLYADTVSFILVVVGSFAAALWATPIDRVVSSLKAVGKTFKPPNLEPQKAIENIIALSNLARRESILAMEEPVKGMDDPFLMKGIMLVVDGADPELVRNVLETEIAYTEARHANVRSFWDYLALAAPSWGMMGTLVSLINMLDNLDDVAMLGPNMALAIITTFYGNIVANVLASPVSSKLKMFSGDEMLVKEVLIEGILSIQAGDNPRYIEEKLKAFLSPDIRGNSDDSNE